MTSGTDFESKLGDVKAALDTAMSRIQSGEDRQALIQVMIAVASLHDAFLATARAFAEVLVKDAK
jgi:hypothetical protein